MSSDTPQSSLPSRPQRVLACVLCQQRKVKCDRNFPCANCIRSRAQCVPATLSQRRRKRRFPERELLDRLRKYEDLMRQNNIPFEPLHKDSTEKKVNDPNSDSDTDAHGPEAGVAESVASTSTVKDGRRNVWHMISRGFRDTENDSDSSHDEVREAAIKTAWDQTVAKDDNLLFGSRDTTVELSTLHPDPVQIFRLWQVYLDNVNPLLKVTHTPTLQPRIIEAAGKLASINSTLEALMFGIYCMSITSLATEDCQTMFGSSKEDLLTRYQFGCQQALYRCCFLRSNDPECLTALYFYLISVYPNTVPQVLNSMLGVAIRIAYRLGIQDESTLAKYSVIEAEMRRRLWWSITLFEYRISETSGSTVTTLDPTWDCKVPLNVNDSDLRPDMKEPPAIQGICTEALFPVVRSELGQYIRYTAYHLDVINPALKPLAKRPQNGAVSEGSEMGELERIIENKYLKLCDTENPLHYMTILTTRAYLAKRRLLEHHASYSRSSASQTDAQRDAATSLAIRMLESDTDIMTSPLTKGFRWVNRFYFPFPAYLQIAQDLRMRPTSKLAARAWEVFDASHDAWYVSSSRDISPMYRIFARVVLHSWEACEEASKQSGVVAPTPPRVVTSFRNALSEAPRHDENTAGYPNSSNNMELGVNDPSMSMSMPAFFADPGVMYNTNDMQSGFAMMQPGMFSGQLEQGPIPSHMDRFNWGAFVGRPNWTGF